jgi:hypothetical protein
MPLTSEYVTRSARSDPDIYPKTYTIITRSLPTGHLYSGVKPSNQTNHKDAGFGVKRHYGKVGLGAGLL